MATVHTTTATATAATATSASGAPSAARTSISASLPSLLARTLPAPGQRRRPPAPGSAVSAEGERAQRLVSTECQTELAERPASASLTPAHAVPADRVIETEPPRRRRREKRRQHRRSQNVQPLQEHVQQALHEQADVERPAHSPAGSDHLPDILNAHMPPPYSTLPHNSERCMGMGPIPFAALPVPVPVVPVPLAGAGPGPAGAPAAAPLLAGNSFSLPPPGGRRSRGSMYAGEESGKSCCGVMVTQTVSIRWFIIMIAFVGICCAVVGTVLGAMRSSGREHLTVSLLMIGVGIVLITVSGIAWRLTSQDAPSCRAMLGLGGSSLAGAAGTPMLDSAECGAGVNGLGAEANGRRFLSRIPPTYGRPHHPYAAMMYPEFQYRPPPPSYQASMQEYRLRLLLLDRDRQQQQQTVPSAHSTPLSRACVAASGALPPPPPPVSPPPTYRSQANTLLRPSLPMRENEMSRPPSYRSRNGAPTAVESRTNEQQLNQSQQQHQQQQQQQQALLTTNRHDESNGAIHPSAQHPHSVIEAKIKCTPLETVVVEPTKRDKDNNTVTIVQTQSSSQVLARRGNSPVLVTVTTSPTVHHSSSSSSASSASSSTPITQNLQVLAQL